MSAIDACALKASIHSSDGWNGAASPSLTGRCWWCRSSRPPGGSLQLLERAEGRHGFGAKAPSDTEHAFSHSRSPLPQEIKMFRENRLVAAVVHQRSVFTLLGSAGPANARGSRPRDRQATYEPQPHDRIAMRGGRPKLRPNRMLPGPCRLSERGRNLIPRTLGLARGWRGGSVLDHVHPRNPLRQVSPSSASSRRRS